LINLLASNLIKLNHFLYYLIPFKSTITFYKKGIKDSESRIIPFKSKNSHFYMRYIILPLTILRLTLKILPLLRKI
jgi:hypothetical protein